MQELPEIGTRVRYIGPTAAAYHETGEGVTGTVVDHVPLFQSDVNRVDIPRPANQWHVRVAVDETPTEWTYMGRVFSPKVTDVELLSPH